MNQPYGPRRLRRSRTDRYVGGVCGGVAAYLNMDATLVRILTVVVTLFTGVPVVLYLVALFLMPEESLAAPVAPPVTGSDPVWGAGGPPWAQAPGAQSAGTQDFGTQDFGTQAPTAAPWDRPAAPHDPPRRDGGAG